MEGLDFVVDVWNLDTSVFSSRDQDRRQLERGREACIDLLDLLLVCFYSKAYYVCIQDSLNTPADRTLNSAIIDNDYHFALIFRYKGDGMKCYLVLGDSSSGVYQLFTHNVVYQWIAVIEFVLHLFLHRLWVSTISVLCSVT